MKPQRYIIPAEEAYDPEPLRWWVKLAMVIVVSGCIVGLALNVT